MHESMTVTVGLDLHARSIRLAAIRADELLEERTLPYDEEAVERLLRRWPPVRCCYEAGPTGFGLYRHLIERGIDCAVVAPGLVPQRPGERVKTDPRDARRLARPLAGGLLEPIHVLSGEFEAARDLVRAREDARLDRMRDRQRLSKFCLRHGRLLPTTAWTVTRRKWFSEQRFEFAAQQQTFDTSVHTVDLIDARIGQLERAIRDAAELVTNDDEASPDGRIVAVRVREHDRAPGSARGVHASRTTPHAGAASCCSRRAPLAFLHELVQSENLTIGDVGRRAAIPQPPHRTDGQAAQAIGGRWREDDVSQRVARHVSGQCGRWKLKRCATGAGGVRGPDRQHHLIRGARLCTIQLVDLVGVDVWAVGVNVLDEPRDQRRVIYRREGNVAGVVRGIGTRRRGRETKGRCHQQPGSKAHKSHVLPFRMSCTEREYPCSIGATRASTIASTCC